MSTNLEYREKEKVGDRSAKLNEKKTRQRTRAREKKQRRHFFVGGTTWKICSGGEKMRNASVHQGENSEQRHFLHKTCNPGSFWQFHVVVVQNNDNEMYKKSVLHEQSCFFAN